MGYHSTYRGCRIIETPSAYVVTDEHGKTIGESKTIAGCHGIADAILDMPKYALRAYYDGKLRGLADYLYTNDESEAASWIWEHCQRHVVEAVNNETGARRRYDDVKDPHEDDLNLP